MRKFWMLYVAALAASATLAQAQGSVERGKYLVEGILTCGNCHSPRVAGGALDTARLYAGGPQTWDTPEYTVKGSNITPDKETGIGAWSASGIRGAIRAGRRPSGQQLSPQMPYPFYRIFTNDDLDAVVAYLRSLPPVSNEVAAPVYKVPTMHVDIPPGADRPLRESEIKGNRVKRGFYLVTIGHCMECHTPAVNGRRDFNKALGTGGERFRGPFGESVSRNITSHQKKGIGAWSDEEIKRAITQGVGKGGRKLLPPMGYAWYARMTPADLDAIVAYLRTVPAKE
jgi:mono/diheme cytochrome c family protein